jgi:hypothetical protein
LETKIQRDKQVKRKKREVKMKKIVYLGIIIVSLMIASSVFASPLQWSDNGHYYDVISGNYNWNAAKTDAESRSFSGMLGHLATITTQGENSFIISHFNTWSWIGGYQYDSLAEPYGHWAWVTGEPWGSPVWGQYGADHYGGNENNVELISSWGGMNDLVGSTVRGSYVIEYEPLQSTVPEPMTMSLVGVGLVGLLLRRKKA